MILIEKRGRRIVIHSEAPLAGLKSLVPGAYETVSGYWTVPLSIESCKLLRQKYGRQLRIGSELRRWAQGVVDSRQYMAELSKAEDAELEHLPTLAPKLYKAMGSRKYQRVGVRFLADNHASGLFDDPGLGKTLIAMGGILEAQIPGPYLIVAPKTAADSVWRREILRWLPEGHRPVILPQMRLQRERKLRLTRYGPKTWLIVHPEAVMMDCKLECQFVSVEGAICGAMSRETTRQNRQLECGHLKDRKTKKHFYPSYSRLFEIEWGAIVVDESHDSLIRRTGRVTQRRRGLDKLSVRADGMRIAMSGTPFDSKPHQLWGTLNWLDPIQHSAFHRWAELYWKKDPKAGFKIGEFNKDREKMLWDSITAIALRRTKAEVAPDLPPKTYVGTPLSADDPESPIGVWLEMEPRQARAYEQMEQLSVAELKSGRLQALTALAELTRLKQFASSYGDIKQKMVWYDDEYGERVRGPKDFFVPRLPSNKFNWIVEQLEEWGYPRDPIDKVVIVSFYTGILEQFQRGIERHFKSKRSNPLCTAITGKTKSQDRRGIIDRFNEPGNEHVMLLNVKAGGTSITIDSADRMIFVSETRIPDQQKQAEDRIHRVSNPRHCMYYYLRSIGTVDVGTALVNQEMIADSHRLLDGRRGVEYMRHVIDLSKAT